MHVCLLGTCCFHLVLSVALVMLFSQLRMSILAWCWMNIINCQAGGLGVAVTSHEALTVGKMRFLEMHEKGKHAYIVTETKWQMKWTYSRLGKIKLRRGKMEKPHQPDMTNKNIYCINLYRWSIVLGLGRWNVDQFVRFHGRSHLQRFGRHRRAGNRPVEFLQRQRHLFGDLQWWTLEASNKTIS